MIFKILSSKNLAKKLAFLTQTKAKLAKIAENCDHSIDPRLFCSSKGKKTKSYYVALAAMKVRSQDMLRNQYCQMVPTFSDRKNPIWVNFGRSCNGSCWYFYGIFCLFYDELVYFLVICYILWLFEIFSPFWYVVQRKICQPGSK
jgi:hypothetical protein